MVSPCISVQLHAPQNRATVRLGQGSPQAAVLYVVRQNGLHRSNSCQVSDRRNLSMREAGPRPRTIVVNASRRRSYQLPPRSITTQDALPSRPRVAASFAVSFLRIGSFAGTHEAVARAVINDRLVGLPGRLHLLTSIGHGSIDPGVIACIESVHGGLDASHCIFLRRRTIKNESAGKVGAVGGEAESLPSAPAETRNKKLSARGRKFQCIVGDGI